MTLYTLYEVYKDCRLVVVANDTLVSELKKQAGGHPVFHWKWVGDEEHLLSASGKPIYIIKKNNP
jgi:hypothetical protein